MYILDTHTDPISLEEDWVTLEVHNDKQTGAEIRPVFDLPARLETGWFSLSEDETWFLFLR